MDPVSVGMGMGMVGVPLVGNLHRCLPQFGKPVSFQLDGLRLILQAHWGVSGGLKVKRDVNLILPFAVNFARQTVSLSRVGVANGHSEMTQHAKGKGQAQARQHQGE